MRVVREASFRPVGPAYEPRKLLMRPLRALRGGADGIAVGFVYRAGELRITVMARGACSAEDVEWALGLARGIAAIDDDPRPFLADLEGHAFLADLGKRYDARLSRLPTLFEGFATAVIEQLVTGWESRRSTRRLWAFAGEPIPGTALKAAPTPAAVRRVPMWKMHEMGIGSRRATTLHESAKRGAAIERLRALPPEEVIAKLETLRGVGPWTANVTADYSLGYADAVPVNDFHAPRIVSQVLAGIEDGTNETMLAALEPFRPHRARVVRLLYRSLTRDGPLPRVDAHRREPWRY